MVIENLPKTLARLQVNDSLISDALAYVIHPSGDKFNEFVASDSDGFLELPLEDGEQATLIVAGGGLPVKIMRLPDAGENLDGEVSISLDLQGGDLVIDASSLAGQADEPEGNALTILHNGATVNVSALARIVAPEVNENGQLVLRNLETGQYAVCLSNSDAEMPICANADVVDQAGGLALLSNP